MARIVVAMLVLLALARPSEAIKAFPGAEGFGAESLGGRGADPATTPPAIRRVTTLADAIPAPSGSFREALEASGPRIVVFDVGGVIHLKAAIIVDDPYLTVAGQTAPGDGIAIDRDTTAYFRPPNDPNDPGDHLYPNLLVIRAHDVVLRHLRLRPAGQGMGVGSQCDVSKATGLSIKQDAEDVIVDHCSMSWGNDSSLESAGDAHDVTIQWSIVSEGIGGELDPSCIDPNTGNPVIDPPQGFTSFDTAERFSLHHNLFAYNQIRNPSVGNGLWDIVNNVLYNTRVSSEAYDHASATRIDINYVANRLIEGPDSVGLPMLRVFKYFDQNPAITTRGYRIFLDDNVGPGTTADSWVCWFASAPFGAASPCTTPGDWLAGSRHTAPQVTTTTPVVSGGTETLWLELRDQVGATAPLRDYVDDCLADEVDAGTGGRAGYLYDVADGCRGASAYALTSTAWPGSRDADQDGMPDTDFESYWGVSDPVADDDGDGYLNIEEFLNGTVPVPIDFETQANANDGDIREHYNNGYGDTAKVDNAGEYRVGDDNTSQRPQWLSILSFDTDDVPADAVIVSATLSLNQTATGGNPASLGDLVADVKTGTFGNAYLEATDFEAAATANAVVTLTDQGGGVFSGDLDAAGLAAINRAGLTQVKVRFTLDDDNDAVKDYRDFSESNPATLTLSYE
jgi:hypothetical protein